MILVPLLVLVLLVAGALGVVRLATGGGGDEHGTRWLGAALAVGGVVAVLVVGLAALLLMRGARAPIDDDDEPAAEPRAAVGVESSKEHGIVADVELRAAFEVSLDVPPVLTVDAPGDAVVVRGSGFPPNSTGTVRTCTPTCTNAFPVRFDDEGTAVVQYVLDAAATRPCREGDVCTIELESVDVHAAAPLLVGRHPPAPPSVHVSRLRGLHAGDRVEVTVNGAADRPLDVVACPASATSAVDCPSRAALGALLTVPRGTGKIVVVDRRAGAAIAPAMTVLLAPRPGPRYSAARVAGGMFVALALATIAVRLVRSTDWHPEREAEVPAFDRKRL